MSTIPRLLSDLASQIPLIGGAAAKAEDAFRATVSVARIGLARIPPQNTLAWLQALRRSDVTTVNIGAALDIYAATRPDSIAVSDSAGNTTYSELNERVDRLAAALSALGARSGGRLGIMLPNCHEAIESIAAAARLGMRAVPINTRFEREEVLHLLESQGIDHLVFDDRFRDRVDGFSGNSIVRGADYEAVLARAEIVELARASGRGDGAKIVVHTSGTTGHPKGAEREIIHVGPLTILSFVGRVSFAESDRVVVAAPVFHSLGLVGVITTLIFGATVVFQERFDPVEFCELLDGDATAAVVVPVMLRRVVDLDAATLERFDFGAMRWMLVSGSRLPKELARSGNEIFGDVIKNLYGSTEAGWISISTPDDLASRPDSVGRPLLGVDVEILGDDGAPVGRGEHGEIVVRSKSVFSGYTSDDVERDRRAAYHVGDLGYFDDDGYLNVLARRDDMVVTGGENVYPAEVERVLIAEPNVTEVAVLGIEDSEYGQIIVAFVKSSSPDDFDAEALRSACRARLANYKVPKHVWAVPELPRNAVGKVLRRVLAQNAVSLLEGNESPA